MRLPTSRILAEFLCTKGVLKAVKENMGIGDVYGSLFDSGAG